MRTWRHRLRQAVPPCSETSSLPLRMIQPSCRAMIDTESKYSACRLCATAMGLRRSPASLTDTSSKGAEQAKRCCFRRSQENCLASMDGQGQDRTVDFSLFREGNVQPAPASYSVVACGAETVVRGAFWRCRLARSAAPALNPLDTSRSWHMRGKLRVPVNRIGDSGVYLLSKGGEFLGTLRRDLRVSEGMRRIAQNLPQTPPSSTQ